MKIFFVVLAIVLGLVTILFGLQLLGVALFVRLVIAILWTAPCWMKLRPYDESGSPQGAVIAILGVPWRECGAGPQILFRPFGIPIESVVREVKIDRLSFKFGMDVKTFNTITKDRDVSPISVAVNGEKRIGALINLLKYGNDEGKRQEAIQEQIKSIINDLVYNSCTDRDDIHKKIKPLGDQITAEFKATRVDKGSWEDYLGVTIDSISITDIAYNEELKKAQEDQEVAEQEAAAADVRIQNFEKRVLVAQGDGKGKLSREQAVNTVLTIDGKRKVEAKTIDIGSNLSGVINKSGNKLAKGIEGFLEYLNPKQGES